MIITYAIANTPVGVAAIGCTEKGICSLVFASDSIKAVDSLKSLFPDAYYHENAKNSHILIDIFGRKSKGICYHLDLHGTVFQLRVWDALSKIPFGQVVSYSSIAKQIGKPTASRAVGNAVGQNRIAYLIPCHRVVRESKEIGGFRWGTAVKKALLEWEKA